MPVKAAPFTPPSWAGFFGSVTGLYARSGHEDSFIAPLTAPASPDNGFGWAVYAGYRFDNMWDVALGVSGAKLKEGSQTTLGVVHTVDGKYWAFDAEVGRTFLVGAGSSLRPFAGVRYAKWTTNEGFPSGGGGAPGSAVIDTSGWGPRIGVDGKFSIAQVRGLSLFGHGSFAYLYGDLDESGAFSGGFAAPNQSIKRDMTNWDFKLGVSYEVVQRVAISVGYSWEYWKGATLLNWSTAVAGPGTGSLDRKIQGPFARLSFGL